MFLLLTLTDPCKSPEAPEQTCCLCTPAAPPPCLSSVHHVCVSSAPYPKPRGACLGHLSRQPLPVCLTSAPSQEGPPIHSPFDPSPGLWSHLPVTLLLFCLHPGSCGSLRWQLNSALLSCLGDGGSPHCPPGWPCASRMPCSHPSHQELF